MSLNRYEQAIFDYWARQPDERRHWQSKVVEAARRPGFPADIARDLERHLRAYALERSAHVPALREHQRGERGVSLLNLAEHLLRIWGPPPKPKQPVRSRPGA